METRSDRGVMLLIHGPWFHRDVWTPWLEVLDEAGYDAVVLSWGSGDSARSWVLPGDTSRPSGPGQSPSGTAWGERSRSDFSTTKHVRGRAHGSRR